eukprot:278837-Prymnesium_polylepis.1
MRTCAVPLRPPADPAGAAASCADSGSILGLARALCLARSPPRQLSIMRGSPGGENIRGPQKCTQRDPEESCFPWPAFRKFWAAA